MITRSQMRRQLRAKGGIMNAVPRQNYGIGSWVKERIRKLIPNELADIAVKAAPFVAPFNPGIAAAMRGIGRFDQRGSISDALKQGLGTYGFGKAAGYLGGAQSDGGIFGGQTFSKEGFKSGPVGRLFQKPTVDRPIKKPDGTLPTKIPGFEPVQKATEFMQNIPIIRDLPPLVQQQILVGGVTSAGTYIYQKFLGEEPPQDEGETMEEYLARRKENVGKKMRSYFDNYFKFDKEYSSLDDAGKDAFVARYNMMSGGRAGYQTGGITMANTLAENMRRNLANQQAVSQQFQAARSRLPGYVAPQRTPVQEYAMSDNNILGPLSKQAASTIIEGQDKSKAALDVLNQTMTPTSAGEAGGIITDGPNRYRINADGSRTMIGSIEAAAPTPDASTNLTQYSNIPELTRLIDDNPNINNLAEADDYLKMQDEEILAERELNPPTQPFFPSYNDPLPYDQLMAGFAEWKRNNPDKVSNVGTMAIVPVTLPGGYEVTYSGGAEANNMRQYLESIGQAPMQRREYSEPIKSIGDGSGLASMGLGIMPPIAPEGGGEFPGGIMIDGKKYFSEQEAIKDMGIERYNQFMADGGRVGFSDGSNLKIKLKQIGYEDTLLDGMSIKELRELLDSEKGTFTDQGTYREPANMGGIMGMPMGEPRVNQGGVTELDYRAKGGFVPVGIKEKADDVPAMLSKNEFVFTADAVRGAGNGSIEKGAQKMYDTMKNLERRVT